MSTYEAALAADLGAGRARELRTALERIVERAGASGDLAARRSAV